MKETFANRMKEAMLFNNMKQVELCEKTGLTKSAISQYLSGTYEPKQKGVYLIATALDVSEAWLMGYDVPIDRVEHIKTSATFEQKLNGLMEANHLNKHTLSKGCDIPYTTIDGWYKKGNKGIKISTLRKLAEYFGTSVDFWIDDQECPKLTIDRVAKINGATDFEIKMVELYFKLDPRIRLEIIKHFKEGFSENIGVLGITEEELDNLPVLDEGKENK